MRSSSASRAAIRFFAVLGLVSFAAAAGCGDVQRPLESAVAVRLEQIYDAGAWLKRVPTELAVSFYARAKLRSFIGELELPRDVEERLAARLEADDFVDELIPFLLFVRTIYRPPEGTAARTFDDHARARFTPRDAIPGMEHTHFRWEPPDDAGGGPAIPKLDREITRQLVSFYDVLYLRGEDRERIEQGHVTDRLACTSRTDLASLETAVRQAGPSVRGLLAALEDAFSEQQDLAAAIRGMLDDPARTDAATAALIRFLDQSVCRHYRFFAARAFRTQQLERWMKAELDSQDGGALWEYLKRAQTQRRYGAVIVVDGLQGRLVEALANGLPADPFLAEIQREMQRSGGPAPSARSLRAAPGQATDFLSHAATGFSHPDYLPFFRRLLAAPRTHAVPVGISTTPTISVRNIPIALTGAPVSGHGGTGLPNFHFVERGYVHRPELGEAPRGRGYYFYGSDAVELTALAQRAGMQSLFDRMPRLSSMSCNAQYDERSQYSIDALVNLALGEKLRDFGERLCAAELDERARNERTLRGLRERLLTEREALSPAPAWQIWTRFGKRNQRALAAHWIEDIARLEQQAMPELLVVYNPWLDHFAHFEGPFSNAILSPTGELNRLDYWLGRIDAAYRSAGVDERTVFGMAGDHGLSPVFHLLNPEVEIFDALRAEGSDFRVEKISSDEGEGPKLTNPFDPPSMKGIDVVVASTAGGNYMLDLFVDQAESFTRQPLASELRAIRPLRAPDDDPIDLLAEIERRLADSLDYLAVRETSSTPDSGSVLLLARRGGATATARVRRQGDAFHYSFDGPESAGADLLATDRLSPYESLTEQDRADHTALRARCLSAPPEDPGAWCRTPEWRQLTSYTTRPDSVVQIGHLYDSERAGTINLFPRDGVGYNSTVPGRHAGESYHEKNAFVAIWGAPLAPRTATTAPRSAVNGAVPMAIHAYVSGATAESGGEGWGYVPLPAEWLAP